MWDPIVKYIWQNLKVTTQKVRDNLSELDKEVSSEEARKCNFEIGSEVGRNRSPHDEDLEVEEARYGQIFIMPL